MPRAANPGEAAQPQGETLEALRTEAADCRACPLWAAATQTVFGEGRAQAPILFVGEQPGDQEDLQGRPFVGPAGQLFDRALAQAGIDRGTVYVTNAVKHFKYEPRGKRRIHQRPNTAEIRACHPWLASELAVVRPRLIVALGATAARALFGRPTPVAKNRGRVIEPGVGEIPVLVTVHPSFLLRLPDEAMKAAEYDRFVEDLQRALAFARTEHVL